MRLLRPAAPIVAALSAVVLYGALCAALSAATPFSVVPPTREQPAQGQPAQQGEDVRITMPAAGTGGLEAVVLAPAGPGRHPLVLVSHGSPRDGADRAGMTARSYLPLLRLFARQGFVAAAVLRRGYGSSGGGWAEGYGPCAAADYEAAGRAGAADLAAAIAALRQRPDVDPARIVAVGVSAGGFATVALTAAPPQGLVAAVSFAGGRGSRAADEVCDEPALVGAFAAFGRRSRVPMLWVYAENDHFFGPALAQRLLAAFRGGGGVVEFVAAPPFGSDGHGLFSLKGKALWQPLVQAFLARHGISTEDGAEDGRAGGGGVELKDAAAAPPELGAAGRLAYADFQAAGAHKAFAVASDGRFGWRSGRNSRAEAEAAALARCQAGTSARCRIAASD